MLQFDAPLDFDPQVREEFRKLLPTAGIWHEVTVWVCNPKANFVINDKELDKYANLKILATPSTGLNHIDLDACAKRGVKVISLLDDRAGLDDISASAEFTFKLILDALRIPPPRELQGKRVGLVGFGRNGKKLARWCEKFDTASITLCDPLTSDISPLELFKTCDVVVVCCTYDKSTHHMIGAELLRSMKQGAALVNTSRGEVIDEYALAMVMEERPDLRVAVDVLEGETTGTQNPQRLISRGAIVTPHIAGETYDSRTKAARIILNLLKKEL